MKILTVSEHWTSSGTPSWPLVFFSSALSTHKTFCRLFVCLPSPAKKQIIQKKFHKIKIKIYIRETAALPRFRRLFIYLFISATAMKELTRMCRARISRNRESASRRQSVQAKLERSKLRASTSLHQTKRVTDWPENRSGEQGFKCSLQLCKTVKWNTYPQLNKVLFCLVFIYLFIWGWGGGGKGLLEGRASFLFIVQGG